MEALTELENVISVANIARQSKEGFLSNTELTVIAKWVKADYPYLTLAEVNKVIEMGAKGLFSVPDQFTPLNAQTIYGWFGKAYQKGVIVAPAPSELLNGAVIWSPEAIELNAEFHGLPVSLYLEKVFKCTAEEYERVTGNKFSHY